MDKCVYCHQDQENVVNLGFSLCDKCNSQLSHRKQTVAQSTQNVYIYTRVSTKQQNTDENSGIFIQTRQCIEYCFDNNLTCHGVYEDIHSAFNMRNTGLSGLHQMIRDLGFDIWSPSPRRIKNKVVAKIRKAIQDIRELVLIRETDPDPHIDFVIVANIDRFGRDILNMIALKNQLEAHDTHIISVGQLIKTGTDKGEMAFRREAMEAELFSRDRSCRMKSVKSAKKALGNFMGGRPRFGYKISKINGIRREITDHSEQKIIDIIHRLENQGKSPSVIARHLNSMKLNKRGKTWTSTSVSSVISRKYDNNPLPDHVNPPIINDVIMVDIDDMDI